MPVMRASAGDVELPHNQTQPPNPPRSPREAREKFTVPQGFHVQLAAAEPDIVNPVAMTWDDRGRLWVCESIEYPRHAPGPGRDRIRIHEDTDSDGDTDRVKTFVDGLNIPSGIAIGYGGVFVANSPDLLFMTDTDGDDKADRTEVLLTGFGRDDTHELPNSLTWGPDGWLYGLNGVFNPSKITHQGRTHEFTCALWRYHPRTRAFEVYAEGTSNPWGLDYNRNGAWFVSACVIDHLFHLTQTGYYDRQAGEYPPHTWKIESIVKHTHQKAAYCGLAFYDADVYPRGFRGDLFMGNIHGGCINRDRLRRNGSTYFAEPGEDFLSGHDTWFMPVSVQVGPDGCFWVLDWYDRYHCYQDAGRDADGIDRLRGRLWRITYGNTPMPEPFDLSRSTDEQLVGTLSHPNVWWRRKAQRILTERGSRATADTLKPLALASAPNNGAMSALWTLVGRGGLDPAFQLKLLRHPEPAIRAWGVRSAAEAGKVEPPVFDALRKLAVDSSPDVRLEVIIASSRFQHEDAFALLREAMIHPAEDPLIPYIAWQNLRPRLDTDADSFVSWILEQPISRLPTLKAVAERLPGFLVSARERQPQPFITLLTGSLRHNDDGWMQMERACLDTLWQGIRNGEISKPDSLLSDADRTLIVAQMDADEHLAAPATAILTTCKHPLAVDRAQQTITKRSASSEARLCALQALLMIEHPSVIPAVRKILASSDEAIPLKRDMLSSLASSTDPAIGDLIVAVWPSLTNELHAAALDVLSSRLVWARTLLSAIQNGTIPPGVVNANHIRKMLNLRDAELAAQVRKAWGMIRDEPSQELEGVIRRMKAVVNRGRMDPAAGQRTFQRLCIQCHRMYDHGADVGPDLTANGRASLDQILSNVLDPNQVIGESYMARTIWTTDGQVFNGLLVEDSPARVILKMPGPQQQVIPRGDIEEMRVSKMSLMPEELEKGLSDQEFRDLVGFLLTTKPPQPWSSLDGAP